MKTYPRAFACLCLSYMPALAQAGLADPRAISNNVLWLDGSDVDGDFTAGGQFMNGSLWVDKSSAGNASAQQSSSGNRPSVGGTHNGLSVVTFDGSDYMDVSSNAFSMLRNVSGATIFLVARPTQRPASQSHRVFMVSTGANSAASRVGFNFFDSFGASVGGSGDGGLAGRRLDTDSYQRINGGTTDLVSFDQWTGVFDYANGAVFLYQNGVLVTTSTNFQSSGNTSNTNSLNIRLGADAALSNLRGLFTGDLAELIVFNRRLSTAERQLVEAYLHNKWSVTSLTIKRDSSNVILSWPVTTIGWTLKSSTSLRGFEAVETPPITNGSRFEVSYPISATPSFFRLER